MEKETLGFIGILITQFVAAGLAAWSVIRTRRKDAVERAQIPRAQIDLECRFFGPINGRYIAEVRAVIDNKGHTDRHFKQVKVTIRGLDAGAVPEVRKMRGLNRVDFPETLFKDDGEKYWTVEPGIRQIITVPGVIPEHTQLVLIHTKLVPGEGDPPGGADYYTEERIFHVLSDGPAMKTAKPALTSGPLGIPD